MKRLVHIDNFDGGLVTNVDQGDLPLNSMVELQNVRNDKPGMLRGVPPYVKFADLPSTIEGDVRFFQEVVINDTQTLICWGLDSGSVQHFYWSTDTGSNWTEMTEFVAVRINTVSSTTVFTLEAGSSPFNGIPEASTDDYYNQWWCYLFDVSASASELAFVSDYVASTRTLTINEATAFSGGFQVNIDLVILMRFPLWNIVDLEDLADSTLSNFDDHRNFVRDDGNFKPSIVHRQDAISIFTGRKKDNLEIGIDNHSNLWFGHVTTGILLNETVFDFTGLHAERKFLDSPNEVNLINTAAGASSSEDPVPDNKIWGFIFTFLYDGFQESPVFIGKENIFGFNEDILAAGQILDLSAATTNHVSIPLSWDRYTTIVEMNNHHGSRRFTSMRIFMCQCERVAVSPNQYRPTTPLFFVKEIKMNSGWGGSSPGPYTRTEFIFGRDWEAGKSQEAELVHGYFSKIRINADFGTRVNGVEVVASLVIGVEDASNAINRDENKAWLIYSAINSALRNAPDTLPESDIKDMTEHGIYEIFNIKPLNSLLAVFGERKLSILNGTEEIDSHEQRGVNWYWSVVSKGDKLFWGNTDSMYELVQGGRPKEIGFAIRGDWQALSVNNRKKSIAVYDNQENTFILHSPSGTTYIYDELRQSWRTYFSDKSWEWLSIGVDGEVLATDKTDIFHLFPDSGSTETLVGTVEWILDFEDYVSVKYIELMYKLTGVIEVKIFDLEKSDIYQIGQSAKFFSKSEFDNENKRMSFRAKKIRLQLTITPTAATNHNYEIDYISLHGSENTQVNQ